MKEIDLNADVGEGMGSDVALMPLISSASIACAGHAGDEDTMRAAVLAAMAHGVTIGAHPGFSDPENFGRRRLQLPVREIVADVGAQVRRLATIAASCGTRVAYVKLHGALANMAAEDETLAAAIFTELAVLDAGLGILAPAGSAQERAALKLGLSVASEAYADRAYLVDGQLAPRSMPGAVLERVEDMIIQVLRIAEHGEIIALNGQIVGCAAQSICVHGDNPHAVDAARQIRKALTEAGFSVKSPVAFLQSAAG